VKGSKKIKEIDKKRKRLDGNPDTRSTPLEANWKANFRGKVRKSEKWVKSLVKPSASAAYTG